MGSMLHNTILLCTVMERVLALFLFISLAGDVLLGSSEATLGLSASPHTGAIWSRAQQKTLK